MVNYVFRNNNEVMMFDNNNIINNEIMVFKNMN